MTDKAIREKLLEFADRVFATKASGAAALKAEYDAFIRDNNVTWEQRQVFAKTGAGEELHMLLS